MKLYIWNENCVMAGRVDGAYEPEDLYEIQIRNDGPGAKGQSPWAADMTGENEPRSYDVCLADMVALNAADPENWPFAEDNLGDTWRIAPTGDTRCDGDHTEFYADDEAEMINEAREHLRAHPDNSWRSRAYRNILAYLNAPLDPAGDIAEGDFVILFDNAGGALLQTRHFTHEYTDACVNVYDAAKNLVTDVREFLKSGSTAGWDGDQPEFRRAAHSSDDVMTREDADALLAPDADLSRYQNGRMRLEFVQALTGREIE